MIICDNIKKIRSEISKNKNSNVIFIPTMGALHQGHISLIKKAKQISFSYKKDSIIVVSIFVNKKQFESKTDYNKYPRNFEKDFDICKENDVDLIFVPDSKEIFKENHSIIIRETSMTNRLCGASRPGHLDGVCLIVLKLFNIIQPNISIFGEKDYQQFSIIKKMVLDLNLNITIQMGSTVRENNGLALSSRNILLNHNEIKESKYLYQSLLLGKSLFKKNCNAVNEMTESMKNLLAKETTAKIDYIEIINPNTLEKYDTLENIKSIVIAIAVNFTSARLIDNISCQR